MRYSVLTCILIIFSLGAKSQKLIVSDKNTGTSIENVYIYCNLTSTLSDKYGLFDLSYFKACDRIFFQHPAYQSYETTYDSLQKTKKIVLTKKIHTIDEITISANKWKQKKTDIPVNIIKIELDDIFSQSSQTSADLLSSSNKIFVQKSQLGGGSPMIRGFAANRVLLIVDGVRLNNAIFRSGNLQNIISIDPNSLSSAEIILGPGSVIYGSDAIGGVMNFQTLEATLKSNKIKKITGKYMSRFSSANKEITNNINYNVALEKWAYTGSISYSDFSDLRMGKHGKREYYRHEYVETINNEDIITKNETPREQKFSAYSQFNIMQKIRYKPNSRTDILYNFIHSKTSDIPRYDRLILYKDDKLKYAQWYYGPQQWDLHSLAFKLKSKNKFFDNIQSIVAYQNYKESRNDRKLNSTTLRQRNEELDIFSINVDFNKFNNSKSTLFYGIEWTHNRVYSKGQKTNIDNGSISKIASRYPNKSRYSSSALYAKQNYKFSSRLGITTGLRYSHVWIRAKISDEFYDFPFDKIDLNTNAFSGSIGSVYNSFSKWNLKLNLTTGFRAPNIDDISKIFDSSEGKILIPNQNLKAEYVYNFEFTAKKTFFDKLHLESNIFYTILDNAMKREDFLYNGNEKILYDGQLSTVQAIVNSGSAHIYGVSLNANLRLSSNLHVDTNLNYTNGEYKDKSPIRHIPPLFANLSIKHKSKYLYFELNSIYNASISNKNLAYSERDKPHMYAVDKNGNPYSPSWINFDFKSSYTYNNYSFNINIENMFDKLYRPYSSGISAPGRNVIIGINVKFN